MVFLRSDDEEELEAPEDEEATLADDILDEVEEESIPVEEDEMEGFGHLVDLGDKDKKDEKETEEDENSEEGDAPLEEDAEDVDFDTFDDVDEM
jgi:hypothetical protein